MIELLGYILVFISGLFVGSFLNVVSDRVPKNKSPLKGRSKCDYCKEDLKAKDLMPLLSYLWLKAKCRYCDKKLSYYYPLSELLTALMFVGIAYYLQIFSQQNPFIWMNFFYLLVVASFLIIIFLSDIKYKIIPDKVVFPAIGFLLVFMVGSLIFIAISSYLQMKADPFGKYLLEVGYWHDQMTFLLKSIGLSIASALIIAGFFVFLIWITRGKGMGGGDVKLAFLIGLINGFPLNIVAIIVAFVFGALFSGALMIVKKKGMKDVIPFGPFLIFGSIVSFVFGQTLLNWYVSLI